jgi:hypothetical protein
VKIFCHKREQGSVLLTGLIVALAAGVTLASYLVLVSNRCRMTMHSMDWTKAMPVLESGIEEALTHAHDDFSNLTVNGWTAGTLSGQPVFSKFRTNSDGSYFWAAILTNSFFTNPVIYSSGFVPVPLGKGFISRTVKVGTSRPVQFASAVAATGQIAFNGNNEYVDAYNSCNGSYGGTNSHGATSVVTDSTAGGAVSVGNGSIYGTVNTGPGGNVSAGPNSAVGDSSWVSNHNTGIEGAGYTNDTMNVSYPSNSLPANLVNALAPQTTTNVTGLLGGLASQFGLGGATSATVLSGGNYQMSSLTNSSSSSPVLVTGPSTLYISGNLSITGTGSIQILPGGSLTVYVGGSTTTISGQGVVNNSGSPENFSYLGLAGNTSITFSGQAIFYGTIYDPQADFTMTGNADVFGAVIAKSFTNNGNASLHYDRCLGLLGNLVVTSWKETF